MSDETDDRVVHDSIAKAIHAVMMEVGYAYKGGQAEYGDKFTYASDGDMIRAVRPSMLRHGLVLTPAGMVHETLSDQGKSKQILDRVMASYVLRHVDSDQTIDIQMPGNGMDSRDKGVFKALTGAYKYALREIFMIETGDDPEGGDDFGPRNEPKTADDDELDAAFNKGSAKGRAWVIRSIYDKVGQDDDYSGQRFSGQLRKVNEDEETNYSVEDVRMFCLWLGARKPSHRTEEERETLIDYLVSRKGRDKYAEFVKDCGL